MNFVKTVDENIPQINLAMFLNNINTLGTSIENFNISNIFSKRSTLGQYDPKKNAIELSKDTYGYTINHELFHASTTIIDKSTGMIYCGFHQISDNNKQIGKGLNEGYTEYLTEQYFKSETYHINAYVYEKKIAKILETIIGKEHMQLFYFNANLSGLIDYLKKYASEEEIYKFINTLDFLSEHMDDKYLIPSSKEMIKNSFEFINSFLLKTTLRKYIIDSTATQLSTEEVFNSLVPVLTLIPETVKLNNNAFQIGDDKQNMDAITSVMSEYKLSDDRKTISK